MWLVMELRKLSGSTFKGKLIKKLETPTTAGHVLYKTLQNLYSK
jgi:hypothetical protein